jgi:hypothetical protein
MTADGSHLLRALAQTTPVTAAQEAIKAATDDVDISLALNPLLNPGTWTRLWKTRTGVEYRRALASHPLDRTRQELVIRRETHPDILCSFSIANRALTDEQKLRIGKRLHPENPARGAADLRARIDDLDKRIAEGRARRRLATPSDTAIDSAADARVDAANTPIATLLLPYTLWLSRELEHDPIQTWSVAVTLITGGYTGTLRELAATSRLLGAPVRTVTVSPAAANSPENPTRQRVTP